jgi:hypothetical protein
VDVVAMIVLLFHGVGVFVVSVPVLFVVKIELVWRVDELRSSLRLSIFSLMIVIRKQGRANEAHKALHYQKEALGGSHFTGAIFTGIKL